MPYSQSLADFKSDYSLILIQCSLSRGRRRRKKIQGISVWEGVARYDHVWRKSWIGLWTTLLLCWEFLEIGAELTLVTLWGGLGPIAWAWGGSLASALASKCVMVTETQSVFTGKLENVGKGIPSQRLQMIWLMSMKTMRSLLQCLSVILRTYSVY